MRRQYKVDLTPTAPANMPESVPAWPGFATRDSVPLSRISTVRRGPIRTPAIHHPAVRHSDVPAPVVHQSAALHAHRRKHDLAHPARELAEHRIHIGHKEAERNYRENPTFAKATAGRAKERKCREFVILSAAKFNAGSLSSSEMTPRTSISSNWILHFVQNDNPGMDRFRVFAPPRFRDNSVSVFSAAGGGQE
jgi:hypothetical protein